ncbi:MAG: cytochrome c3 family protein [Desulfatitalea sp.]|nr:cytochrome c3 family protein [Desulfatitalea sp.]
MRKNIWIAAATLVVLSLIWGTVWAAEDEMCVPMGIITLEPLSAEAKRVAVEFPHAVHFGYGCQQCHHTWNRESAITGCSASGCHDLGEAPKTEDGRPSKDAAQHVRYFKNAYHGMCIGCHKAINKENQKFQATRISTDQKLAASGPTGCIQCHPTE